MGLFGWLVDGLLTKAGWRSALMDCGGQCVMVDGITMMPELCADNWGTVSAQVICKNRNWQLASSRIMEQPIKLQSGIY